MNSFSLYCYHYHNHDNMEYNVNKIFRLATVTGTSVHEGN